MVEIWTAFKGYNDFLHTLTFMKSENKEKEYSSLVILTSLDYNNSEVKWFPLSYDNQLYFRFMITHIRLTGYCKISIGIDAVDNKTRNVIIYKCLSSLF